MFGEVGCGVEAEDWPVRTFSSSSRAVSDSVVTIKRLGCLSDGQMIVISLQVWLGGPIRAEPLVVWSLEERLSPSP